MASFTVLNEFVDTKGIILYDGNDARPTGSAPAADEQSST